MVNIFLPYPNIYNSLKCLDTKRLGKQRIETKQIIDVLDGNSTGWVSHPAVKAWIGYSNHLKVYYNHALREWISRGFVNNMPFYEIDESLYNVVECEFDGKKATYDNSKFNEYTFPFWVSFPPFYLSHQASLLRKDPKYYSKFFEMSEYLEYGYLWPHTITFEMINNWSYSYLEVLSSGCPVQFRISINDVLQWLSNPNINPKTGRKYTKKLTDELAECFGFYSIATNNGSIYIKYYCENYIPITELPNLSLLNNFQLMQKILSI